MSSSRKPIRSARRPERRQWWMHPGCRRSPSPRREADHPGRCSRRTGMKRWTVPCAENCPTPPSPLRAPLLWSQRTTYSVTTRAKAKASSLWSIWWTQEKWVKRRVCTGVYFYPQNVSKYSNTRIPHCINAVIYVTESYNMRLPAENTSCVCKYAIKRRSWLCRVMQTQAEHCSHPAVLLTGRKKKKQLETVKRISVKFVELIFTCTLAENSHCFISEAVSLLMDVCSLQIERCNLKVNYVNFSKLMSRG